MIRSVALALTVLTGFTGLVYEVTWQKYLATLLGSHSEATAAVLAIFLGGLSVGYALFGVVTRRLVARADEAGRAPRLLFVYGALELAIGVWALAFPLLFQAVQALSYAIPHGPAGLGFAVDVALSALLVGPPAVLMGGTIPILTQALAKSLDDATRFHAFVYAFNTVGAFAGALAAGFVLIPWLGLVGVMLAMAVLNLVAGSVFVWLGRRGGAVVALETPRAGASEAPPPAFAVYALIALLTGFAMMSLQTILIRIGGLAFGSSQFTFSMVVAVFVLCIALGSLAVSLPARIPTWIVVGNQWMLAALFFALYVHVPSAPYRVHGIRVMFRDIDSAFGAFHLQSFLFVLAVLALPVMASGAALPLLFHHLRRESEHLGDLAGKLYSWNTLGSLLGALLGGYALLFWLDLDDVYRIAVAALVVAATLLSLRAYPGLVWAAVTVPLVVGLVILPAWDPVALTLGLFRNRLPRPDSFVGAREFVALHKKISGRIVFYDDDPTATISVKHLTAEGSPPSLSIVTNGKSDSSTLKDLGTVTLLATVPALLAERPERAFVVGWGTGITARTLASFEGMREVDVAEISPGVVAAAPLFEPFTRIAPPRAAIRVIQSDALRALLRSDGRYDVIVSEPSNPWVSGIEMLYSLEFLSAARARLEPGGVYCQWFHQYETDDRTMALVLRTFAAAFDHVAVWTANYSDLMLIGFDRPDSATDVQRMRERFGRADFQAALREVGIPSFEALLAHEVLPLGVLHAAAREGLLPAAEMHTLLHPRLADAAGRAFFRGTQAELPFTGRGAAARTGAASSLLVRAAGRAGSLLADEPRAAMIREACAAQGRRCRSLLAAWIAEGRGSEPLERLLREHADASGGIARERLTDIAALAPDSAVDIEGSVTPARARQIGEDFEALYLAAAGLDPERLLALWQRCVDDGSGACRKGLERATRRLGAEVDRADPR